MAGSIALKVVKVGFASDVENRIKSLNSLGYAGTNDWVLLYWVETKNAGRHEYDTHKLLSGYASPRAYEREGRRVDCLETFACDAPRALEALRKTVSTILSEWVNKGALNQYLFEPKTGGSFVRNSGDRKVESAKPLNRSPKSSPIGDKISMTANNTKSHEGDQTPSVQNDSLFKSAELGDVEAQYILGEIYLDGIESGGAYLQQDYAKALHWCRKAADNNHATAQLQLATMYMEGKGVPEDLEEAYAWATISVVGNELGSIDLRDKIEDLLSSSNNLAGGVIRAAEYLDRILKKQLGRSTQVHRPTQGDAANEPDVTEESTHSFTAVCPACGKLNRIRVSDVHRKPMCGHQSCRSSLVGAAEVY